MDDRKIEWAETFTGKKFYPLDPKVEDIDIVDIAHGLSMICRFGGQCRVFCSVAQHSVIMSDEIMNGEYEKWALLHDAAEAYLGDITRPIKLGFPEIEEFEERILKAIVEKFSLTWPMPQEIRDLDNKMLFTEARDLMKSKGIGWSNKVEPFKFHVFNSWSPTYAESNFLVRYNILFKGGKNDG